MIKDETNLTIELENLKKFQKFTKKWSFISKSYEELCSSSAIVMSFMEGFRFDDKIFAKYNIDFKTNYFKVCKFLYRSDVYKWIFLTDPHPGNCFVNTNGDFILLDLK